MLFFAFPVEGARHAPSSEGEPTSAPRPSSQAAPGDDSDERLRNLILRAWFKNARPVDSPVDGLAAAAGALLLEAFRLIPGASIDDKVDTIGDLLTGEPIAPGPGKEFLLKHISGTNTADKIRNLNAMLGGDDARMGTKLRIVRKILSAIPAGNQLDGGARDEIFAKLRREYAPVLRALGGKDGYFDFADVGPVVNATVSQSEIDRQLENLVRQSDQIPNAQRARAMTLYKTDYRSLRLEIQAAAQDQAMDKVGKRVKELLDSYGVRTGVDDEDERGEQDLAKLDRATLVRLAANEVAVPKLFRKKTRGREGGALPGIEMLSTGGPDYLGLRLFVAFPRGIPVKKLSAFLETGDLSSLRFNLQENGKLAIR